MSDLSKDRKKSAHWTDHDTDVLINVLLRYKDTGRTTDNGFKPEVWREAAELVKSSHMMGGAKTPEACKSRWQRLQRDYKAAREMETLPGFNWDRSKHKLSASPEAWIAASKQTSDAYKYQKIFLPHYEALGVLCPMENPRLKPRAPKQRSSLGGMSDSSSLLSLSVGSGNPQTPQMGSITGTPGSIVNGHVHSMGLGIGDGLMAWDGGDMEEGDYEGTFTMPNGHTFTMTHGQKRVATYDTALITTHHSTQDLEMDGRQGSPKKIRPVSGPAIPPQRSQSLPQPQHSQNHMTTYHIGLGGGPGHSPDFNTSNGSALETSLMTSPTQSLTSVSIAHQTNGPASSQGHQQHQHHQHHHQQNQSQSQAHTSQPSHGVAQHHAHPHTHPHSNNTHPHPHPHSQLLAPLPSLHSNHTHDHNHDHNTDAALRFIQAPSQQPNRPTPPPPSISRLSQSTTGSRGTDKGTGAPAPMTPNGTGAVNPGGSSAGSQTFAGEMSEAQRRTRAILQLQARETDMSDEDMVEVIATFEANVSAADTYLALQRDGLRRLYLTRMVKARKGN